MIQTLPLRRRGHVERRILGWLRGDARAGLLRARRARPASAPMPDHLALFAALRETAARHGIQMQAPDTPYMSMDELRLLGWIAERQRVAGRLSGLPADRALLHAIDRCAVALDAAGLRLPPITLYAARLHDAAGYSRWEVRSTVTGG